MKCAINPKEIDEIMKDDEIIQNEVGRNAQAYLANQRHNIPRRDLYTAGLASNAGITRAKACITNGYDPCRTGRHRKLCDKDEQILFSWIRKLNAKGQTVFVSNVIEMVFLSSLLNIAFTFIGESSVIQIPDENRARASSYNRMGRGVH